MTTDKKISPVAADFSLAAITVIWGSTFIISKQVLDDISLITYLSVRFAMASALLWLICLPRIKKMNRHTLRDGSILGVLLFSTYILQTGGLMYSTASATAFITGMYIIIVPLLLTFVFRQPPRRATIAGALLATAGLFFLSGTGLGGFSIADLLILANAFTISLHIIFTGKFAPRHDVLLLTAVQMTVIYLFSAALAPFPSARFSIPGTGPLLVLAYLAVLGTVLAFLVQTAMQRYTTPARTALIFTLEPVFAALFAFGLGGERLSAAGYCGAALIMTGIAIAETDWNRLRSFIPFIKSNRPHAKPQGNDAHE